MKATVDGGRKSPLPLPPLRFSCPVLFDDLRKDIRDIRDNIDHLKFFDCAFYVNPLSPVTPDGTSVDVPAIFHFPELVKDYLQVGNGFTLWEGKDIGHAKILKIIQDDASQS